MGAEDSMVHPAGLAVNQSAMVLDVFQDLHTCGYPECFGSLCFCMCALQLCGSGPV